MHAAPTAKVRNAAASNSQPWRGEARGGTAIVLRRAGAPARDADGRDATSVWFVHDACL